LSQFYSPSNAIGEEYRLDLGLGTQPMILHKTRTGPSLSNIELSKEYVYTFRSDGFPLTCEIVRQPADPWYYDKYIYVYQ